MSKVKSYKELIPEALLFYTILMPRKPPTRSKGGLIHLSRESQESEGFTNQVAQVVHLGSLAYKAKTPGLDYSQETRKPGEGDWVLFQRNSGTKISFVLDTELPADDPENRVDFVLLTETDLGARLTEKQVKHLVGWTG